MDILDQAKALVGNPGIDWSEMVRNMNKRRRRTIHLGKYDKVSDTYGDEVHIRELPIIQAGLGCSIWDSAIILSRAFYKMAEEERNPLCQTAFALELGAGAALPSIVLGRYCQEMWMTEYVSKLIDNMRYNVQCNCDRDLDWEVSDETEKQRRHERRFQLSRSARYAELDFHDIGEFQRQPETDVIESGRHRMDVLFGTGLIYVENEGHIRAILEVVDHYLSTETGVFYVCQSTDRAGMPRFMELAAERGFLVDRTPCADCFLGNYQHVGTFEQRHEQVQLPDTGVRSARNHGSIAVVACSIVFGRSGAQHHRGPSW
ncbi:MAG: hypothetical protein MHM6MM_007110, partial [Cercozoa sp. M6MM]